jgi:hypothetical protein
MMQQLHTKYIGHRLSCLVVSFVVVLCSCWLFCECQDTAKPIQRQYKGLIEYDSLLKEVPNDIDLLPRLILGQGPMVRDIGCIILRPQDITLDIEPGGDIQGDAWDPGTISAIKSHDKYQGKFSAIIFERISTLPLYWGKYVQALFGQPSNDVYCFPGDGTIDSVVDQDTYRTNSLSEGRSYRHEFYSKGLSHFYDLEKISISALQLPSSYQTNVVVDPQLVTLTSTQESLFEKGGASQILPLEQVITSIAPTENIILKEYYDLLAPGGLLIFSSTSTLVNRYGGIIVEYKEKKYTPFQDLDDPRLQAVYRSIFERAGFVNIQFYKDFCFAEDIILLVAKKP